MSDRTELKLLILLEEILKQLENISEDVNKIKYKV
jgi:hypothetical protein